jgi:uncharacterized protein YbjT (DUF2867 family)
MTVLVMGATGKTGVAVVEALSSRGIEVRAASRHPGLSRAGIEQVRMDWSDSSGWESALRGVDGLYLVGPYAEPDNAGLIRRLLAAGTGVQRVVHLSIIGAEVLPTGIPVAQWELDIRESGLEWTILRPNWFFQNFEESFVGTLRDRGLLELPAADAPISFVDTLDVGEVAATALVEGGHGGRTYTLTGPEAITYSEAVAELGRATSRDLRFTDLAPQEFADRLTAGGAPPWAVDWQEALFELIRTGQNTPVTDTVEAITGRPPRPLSAYADRQAHHWLKPQTELPEAGVDRARG